MHDELHWSNGVTARLKVGPIALGIRGSTYWNTYVKISSKEAGRARRLRIYTRSMFMILVPSRSLFHTHVHINIISKSSSFFPYDTYHITIISRLGIFNPLSSHSISKLPHFLDISNEIEAYNF